MSTRLMHQPVIVERSHRMDPDRALQTVSSGTLLPAERVSPSIGAVSVDVRRRGHTTEVVLAGEIDVATRPALSSALCALIRPGARITVDVTDVKLLDGAGVALLLGMQRHVRARGGELLLANPRGIVARVLQILDAEATLTQAEPT
jgi:anti-anti-sigma factor